MSLPLLTSSFPQGLPLGLSSNGTQDIDQKITRRSGNWPRTTSDYDYLQSLSSEYVGEAHLERANKLKADVRIMLEKASNPSDQLELIDILQRTGLAYHFDDEIKFKLEKIYDIYSRDGNIPVKENISDTARAFRLLRYGGHILPQEVFNNFKDEKGDFNASLADDMKGMLNLYDASFLLMEGESILEDARDFAAKHLKEYLQNHSNKDDQYLSMLVTHALELPLHWRAPRMEAMWFIDAYKRKNDYNPTILELAKLDFNMVQAQHQDEIRDSSRWWNDLELGKKLYYTRERIMENAIFTVGKKWEPEFGNFRKLEARAIQLMALIDDAYDVYGTLEEVEILTEVVDGWDLNSMEQLPDFLINLSFLALFNNVNEMAYFILKEKGINVVPCLKKLWGDLCRSYLQEAKWFYTGYTPTLQEYIENGWVSIANHVLLGIDFLLTTNPLTPEIVNTYMKHEYPDAVRLSSIICRLADDLGTSWHEEVRGDVPKAIECYMHETGATEEEARNHIKNFIDETWKKLNKERFQNSSFPPTFMESIFNIARVTQFCYEYGDGYGIQNKETKDRLLSLFVHPLK